MRVRFRIERMKGLKKLIWETFKRKIWTILCSTYYLINFSLLSGSWPSGILFFFLFFLLWLRFVIHWLDFTLHCANHGALWGKKRPSNMISALFTSSWSPTSSGDSFIAGTRLESMTKRLNFQKIVSWRSLKTMWLFHFYFWILLFLSKIFLSHNQAPVVQKVDNTIQWKNLYSVDNAIGFPNTYSLDCVLSNG